MKKLINDPANVVREELQGIEAAHPDLVRVSYDPYTVVRADAPVQGKVALVSGGGSGHEPMHGGFVGMGMLGMGNGAVFQLVPQRFPDRMGIVTGLVGAAGGLGGFFLPTVLGATRDLTCSYASGLLLFAGVFTVGTIVLLELGARWSERWSDSAIERSGVFCYRTAIRSVAGDRAA